MYVGRERRAPRPRGSPLGAGDTRHRNNLYIYCYYDYYYHLSYYYYHYLSLTPDVGGNVQKQYMINNKHSESGLANKPLVDRFKSTCRPLVVSLDPVYTVLNKFIVPNTRLRT